MPRYLVPGHPIAGSEQSGVTAAKATLFRRHKVILTPSAETDADALALVDSLWRALGADVEHMEVEHHDEVLAATSTCLTCWPSPWSTPCQAQREPGDLPLCRRRFP